MWMIRQIRAAIAAELPYVALFGILALPDICGALESENGKATGPKYKAWLTANVPEEAAIADMLYGLRCSLLHQGSAYPHGGFFPVANWVFSEQPVHPAIIEIHTFERAAQLFGSRRHLAPKTRKTRHP